MKNIKLLFLSLIILTWLSCKNRGKENMNLKVDSTETILAIDTNLVTEGVNLVTTEIEEFNDSIILKDMLNNGFEMVSSLINDKELFVFESDSSEIKFGYLFDPKIKHFYIKRVLYGHVYIDVFKLIKKDFKQVYSYDLPGMCYVGDTIQDVNSDGYLDFLLHWYPSSGCCLRDIYKVHLQNNKGEFKKEYEFVNPIFKSESKEVIGMCYGHYAPFYKFKWNGNKIDTIEYIHVPNEEYDFYYRNKSQNRNLKGVKINKIPEEYLDIWDSE